MAFLPLRTSKAGSALTPKARGAGYAKAMRSRQDQLRRQLRPERKRTIIGYQSPMTHRSRAS